jgi:glycosyltransferase involved in cell wall biosynthesis
VSAATVSPKRKDGVLLVGNFLSELRGTRSVCEDLADRLSQSGWCVFRTSQKPNRLARLADMMGSAWRSRCEYAVAQVDVYSGPAFLWAEAVCGTLRHARKPYVLTLHGGNLPAFSARCPGRVRRLLSLAATVTTPSRFLLEQMGEYRQGLRLLPNALDLSRYQFTPRTAPRARLIWLRAFHEIYNPTLASRAIALLTAEFRGIQLAMAGPDKGDGSLQRLREVSGGLGVMDRIVLPGPVPKEEVPDWVNAGDIFLNTTNCDNTPISVLEAMACGLCIVSTNVGGIPYLLEDEHDALLVRPDDPQAMAAAVRRVLTEPGLAERLSRSAREKAEAFDWSVVLPQWEALLSAVAERRRR